MRGLPTPHLVAFLLVLVGTLFAYELDGMSEGTFVAIGRFVWALTVGLTVAEIVHMRRR